MEVNSSETTLPYVAKDVACEVSRKWNEITS